MKSYLLVFNAADGDRQSILDHIDSKQEIVNWYTCFAAAIFLMSDLDANQLSETFRKKFPERRFFLTEIQTQNKNGWMPKKAWRLINNPGPPTSGDD